MEKKNEPTAGAKIFATIVTVGVFIWLVVSIRGCFTSDESPESPKPYVASQEDAFIMSEQFVEPLLKSPKTAEFPSFGYTEMYKRSIKIDSNVFRVSSYVDSQNSFGALLRANYVAVVKYVGDGKWVLVDIKFDE